MIQDETKRTHDVEICRMQTILKHIGIDESDVILVGGTVLQLLELRPAADVDLILSPSARILLEKISTDPPKGPFEAIDISDGIQVLKNPYRFLGISDRDVFEQKLYIEERQLKFARPELEFGKKLFRNRHKDRCDIILLQRYALGERNWRWDLIPVEPVNVAVNNETELNGKNRVERIRRRLVRLPIKGFNALKTPRHTANKISRFLKDRFWPRQTLKEVRYFDANVSELSVTQKAVSLFDADVRELCVTRIDVGVLLQLQFLDGQFCRYDVLARLAVLEAYLGGDRALLDVYDNMQAIRGARFQTRLMFEQLIESIKIRGYRTDRYPIAIDRHGRLCDGSHRLACALSWGIEDVSVLYSDTPGPSNYGRNWYEENDFSTDFIAQMDGLLDRVMVDSGAMFQLILWPPAQSFIQEVENDLRSQYQIAHRCISRKVDDFAKFCQEIYASDDIDHWKVAKKLYHMNDYDPVVSVFSFHIPNPKYREKQRTSSYLSDAVVKLKSELRDRYKGRVNNYVHDILFHIGDNPAHNRAMAKTMREHGIAF